MNVDDHRSFLALLKQQLERPEKVMSERGFLAAAEAAPKNCDNHLHSFQSGVLIHDIHVLPSYIYQRKLLISLLLSTQLCN